MHADYKVQILTHLVERRSQRMKPNGIPLYIMHRVIPMFLWKTEEEI